MSFEGFEIPEEYTDQDYYDDAANDMADEDRIQGRTKRGNNKTALKTAKSLTATAAAAKKAPPQKASLKKDVDPNLPKKSVVDGTKFNSPDWEMKLKVQRSNDEAKYKVESGSETPSKKTNKKKQTTPRSVKVTEAMEGASVGGEAVRMRSRPTPKKDEERRQEGFQRLG